MILKFKDWNQLSESVAFDPSAKYSDQTFGLPTGAVDTSKVFAGGDGGNWGGSMPRALAFGAVANEWAKKNLISSQKRSRVLTASGNVSDHYTGSTSSYAVDISASGANGDALLAHLMQWFGHPEYKGGSWFNVTKDGYRYQIGWKVADHYDHIHVGVRKSGAPNSVQASTPNSVGTAKKYAGNTFGEKLLNNPDFLQWLYVNDMNAFKTTQPADLDQMIQNPLTKSWFKNKFKLDDNGDSTTVDSLSEPTDEVEPDLQDSDDSNESVGVGTVTKGTTDFSTIVATVINKLEGGYYHPHMAVDNPKQFGVYGNSGETMFGLDRHAGHGLYYKGSRKSNNVQDNLKYIESGAYEYVSPEAKEFWTTIDNLGAKTKWAWNYRGGSDEARLTELAGKIIKGQWDQLSKDYLSSESKKIIESDGRLLFNFVYAVWNGSGWFKKWATDFNNKVKAGEKNPDNLLKFIVGMRTQEGLNPDSQPNSLIAKGGEKIKDLVGIA
jgi:hypothetical protein